MWCYRVLRGINKISRNKYYFYCGYMTLYLDNTRINADKHLPCMKERDWNSNLSIPLHIRKFSVSLPSLQRKLKRVSTCSSIVIDRYHLLLLFHAKYSFVIRHFYNHTMLVHNPMKWENSNPLPLAANAPIAIWIVIK